MAKVTITDDKGNSVEVDTETGAARKLSAESIWRESLDPIAEMDHDTIARSHRARFGRTAPRRDPDNSRG